MGSEPSFNQDDIHPPSYDILGPAFQEQAKKYGNFFHKDPGMEDFSGTDYLEMYEKFKDAAASVAPGVAEAWQSIGQELARVSYEFAFRAGQVRGWEGQAAEAAATNRIKSQSEIFSLLSAARYMNSEVSVFRQSIEAVGAALRDNRDNYRAEVEENKDTESKNRNYQVYAQTTRNLMSESYAPPVRAVSDAVPNLDIGQPHVGTPPPGPGPGGPSSSGGANPQGLPRGGSGSPVMPTSTGLQVPTPTNPQQPQTPTNNTPNPADAANQAMQGASSATQSAGDAAKGATDAAKKAVQQATNAAKQAFDNVLKGAGLPEGVLGLGPKGLSGGAHGAGGGGGGTGSGARELAQGKPSPQIAPASKIAGTPTTAARAGLSAAGGGSGGGGGAPAAGHRGGGDDKVYKGSKALRRQQHGEEIVGETEAVIPVVGAKPAEPSGQQGGSGAGRPDK
ncbi:hypothetical protein [Mycolicibacterium fortuitum]|uniref:hypothetical protein n=1 Tax=Mycolicibacterium fortuitum TaxID=1766 RepID=UPI0026104AEC|nr:hypothetical protein [Mycolicibacterium fortuitum]